MVYPSGRVLNYGYDAAGRVEQISTVTNGAVQTLVSGIAYEPFGPAKSLTFGNGQVQNRTHDLDGRVASYSLGSTTMAIGYDAASRITSIAEQGNAASGNTYGYDALGRLTSVITPTLGQTYAYDVVGNRTQKVNNGSTTTLTYDTVSNRLTQTGPQPIAMDANGSITNKGNATFNYDARGRMVSANTEIGLVQYTINSLQQRVRKVAPTETTVFHYDAAGKLIAEITTMGTGTRLQEYVYLGNKPVAVLK
jgi:YD repeat-containing protein